MFKNYVRLAEACVSFMHKGLVSKETVVLRRWEYYKIIWFYQLS